MSEIHATGENNSSKGGVDLGLEVQSAPNWRKSTTAAKHRYFNLARMMAKIKNPSHKAPKTGPSSDCYSI